MLGVGLERRSWIMMRTSASWDRTEPRWWVREWGAGDLATAAENNVELALALGVGRLQEGKGADDVIMSASNKQ